MGEGAEDPGHREISVGVIRIVTRSHIISASVPGVLKVKPRLHVTFQMYPCRFVTTGGNVQNQNFLSRHPSSCVA